MTSHHEFSELATHLGVTYLGPLGGGMFGACRVEAADGRTLVLKAWPLPHYASEWERGAAIANRMRSRGYPAPGYDGAGAYPGGCWSLQEFLPGEVTAEPTESHVEQLLALLVLHWGAAERAEPFLAHVRQGIAACLPTLRANAVTESMAGELDHLLARSNSLELRGHDVVHYVFHPGNVLSKGDDITGVFDWEGARPGDWRCDLANLVVSTNSARCQEALADVAPPAVSALLVGWHCARYLAFDAANQPEHLAANLERVESRLATWWRG